VAGGHYGNPLQVKTADEMGQLINRGFFQRLSMSMKLVFQK
jgi:hypothetical protein